MSISTPLTRNLLLRSSKGSARIIAVPLSRPPVPAPRRLDSETRIGGSSQSSHESDTNTLGPLTYYQFQLLDDLKTSKAEAKEGGTGQRLAIWAQRKVVGMWDGFGRAEGGWRLRIHQAGERYFNSIDFEEYALKSIDPTLGPTIVLSRFRSEKRKNLLDIGRKGEDIPEQLRIPLLYPSSILTPSLALKELREYVDRRIPLHRKGLYTWSLLTPFTFPLKLIPIIPNLPFFFCAWRVWSHYRALRASEYLQKLLERDAIVPESSEALDKIYTEYGPASAQSLLAPSEPRIPSSFERSLDKHRLLLSKDAIPEIMERFLLEAGAKLDLERAMDQVVARVRLAEQ